MITANNQSRTGVYICHCGTNIAASIDVQELCEFAQQLPNVAVAKTYKYMCSDPGHALIKRDIAQHQLDRIVVAACSPLLHEETFRRAAETAGLNPFLVQIANVREHIAWVTTDRERALAKAKSHLAAAVYRVAGHESLSRQYVPITPRILVLGGGIAGIHAALTLANAGKEVVLVERQSTIGGHMAMFDKTFPTLDCAACVLTPKMSAVKEHPNIELLTYSEVTSVSGSVGSYEVTVRRNARYVDEASCVGCMECIEACVFRQPKFDNEFDLGLGKRKPIYMPFPQAVPPVPVVDRMNCLQLKSGKCKQPCVEACGDRQAIDFKQQPRELKYEVGAIIIATGFQGFDPTPMTQFGYGRYSNVYTALEVERLLNASGPTNGKVLLADGSAPRRVGILHCIGSRDHNYHPYCSRVCCMYSLKIADLIKEKTGADVTNFYIDIRAPGKGFEEFFERVQRKGVRFVRGKVGDVTAADAVDRDATVPVLQVQVDDTLLNRVRVFDVDMLVLAQALEPRADHETIRRLFNMSCSHEGFFLEKHPKLAPVNTMTEGVFLAGACQGPKDIPDTVAQAGAAAAEALAMVDRGQFELEPNTAWVDEDVCSGCKVCAGICPYSAIDHDNQKQTAHIDAALCKGCGTCVAACPSGAAQQHMFTDQQIYAEIDGIMGSV